jgi:cytochrome c-type biogenesis protein CcmE
VSARTRRAGWIAAALAASGLASALVLNAFRANVTFFVSPSQIAAHEVPGAHRFRLGGLVKLGSLRRGPDGLTVHFVVTDQHRAIAVVYHGVLPDLFREGSGVVAQGVLGDDGRFYAEDVLAKHDEKYVPPVMDDALRHVSSDGHAASATLRVATDGERDADDAGDPP